VRRARSEKASNAKAERYRTRQEHARIATRYRSELTGELLDVPFTQTACELMHESGEAAPKAGHGVVAVGFEIIGGSIDGSGNAFCAFSQSRFCAF
jgi:hypothetical protein